MLRTIQHITAFFHFRSSLWKLGWGMLLFFLNFTLLAQHQAHQQLSPCDGQPDIGVYSVDLSENGGLGTTNSIYEWTVLEADFQGSISVLTNSGNQIEIDWGNSPSGTYTLRVIETNLETGCSGNPQYLTINLIDVTDLYQILGADELCEGDQEAYAHPQNQGTWELTPIDGDAIINQNGSLTATKAGEVQLHYTYYIRECEFTSTKTVYIHPKPQLSLADAYVCYNPEDDELVNKATLQAMGIPYDENYEFTWYYEGAMLTTSSVPYIQVNEAGSYGVQATNIHTGCTSAVVMANVYRAASPTQASARVYTDFHDRQRIDIDIAQPDLYEYSFNDGPFQDSNSFVIEAAQGTYPVSIRGKGGCGTLSIEVTVIHYPKFFTPNNDGYNDFWNIESLQHDRQAMIHIFDRYGKLLTTLRTYHQGWDGTYNGKPMPADDYWFLVKYSDLNTGEPKEFRAHFTLKR